MALGVLKTSVRCVPWNDRNMGDLTRADLLELNEIAFPFFFFLWLFFGQLVRGCQHDSSQSELRGVYENVKGMTEAFRCSNISTCELC